MSVIVVDFRVKLIDDCGVLISHFKRWPAGVSVHV